ncbi:MAG: hypothetical protein ACR2GH_20850 [Pseudonocardia sp.]
MDAPATHEHGLRRLCLVVDLEDYRKRSGPEQAAAQAGLAKALDTAATVVGLRREAWYRQDAGDGELAVLPPAEPETILVSDFPAALNEALRAIHQRDGLFLRVRFAIHHGLAHSAAKGYAGAGIIEVRSIADAGPVRRALTAAREARMVVALSDRLFTDVVRGGYTHLRTTDFHKVRIDEEKFHGSAWVSVPGVDLATLEAYALTGDDSVPDGARSAQVSQNAAATHSTVLQAGRDLTHAPNSTVTTVHGDFHMPGGHIGPRHG